MPHAYMPHSCSNVQAADHPFLAAPHHQCSCLIHVWHTLFINAWLVYAMPHACMPHSCAGCRSPIPGGTTSSVVVLDSQSDIQSFTHPPPSQKNLASSAKNPMSSQESTTSNSKSPVSPQHSSVSSEIRRISFPTISISSQTIKTNRSERNRDRSLFRRYRYRAYLRRLFETIHFFSRRLKRDGYRVSSEKRRVHHLK